MTREENLALTIFDLRVKLLNKARQGHLRASKHLGSMGITHLPPHLFLAVQKKSSEVPC